MAPTSRSPYRHAAATCATTDRERPAVWGVLVRDACVLAALVATIASISHWSSMIDAVSEAMGFPRMR